MRCVNQTRPSFPIGYTRTSTALLFAGWLAVVGVLVVKGMSIKAGSFLSVKSSSQILSAADRLQMFRIYAKAKAAKVVKIHSFRDWLDEQFVNDSVSSLSFSVDAGSSVSAVPCAFHPQPAARIRLWQNLAHHAIEKGGESTLEHSFNYTNSCAMEQA